MPLAWCRDRYGVISVVTILVHTTYAVTTQRNSVACVVLIASDDASHASGMVS
ncbi:MAG: hypothetical protein J6X16_04555 [Bacteroidales bacterium]|nr:hypothetical protein [Bacteroidales bacterium]